LEKLDGYGDFQTANMSVLWDSGQRGWHVQAASLPTLPASHQYRLWAVDEQGTLHDCGQAPACNGGNGHRFVKPLTPIETMQGFVVTIEPADPQPTQPSSPAVLISPNLRRTS
jgi:anti-sigma-K factor RskA